MTEDWSAFLRDFGVTATTGSLRALVLLDMPGQSILGAMQISTDYAITYASSDLPGLKHGDSLNVAGVAYTVREIAMLDDGAFSHANLKR